MSPDEAPDTFGPRCTLCGAVRRLMVFRNVAGVGVRRQHPPLPLVCRNCDRLPPVAPTRLEQGGLGDA